MRTTTVLFNNIPLPENRESLAAYFHATRDQGDWCPICEGECTWVGRTRAWKAKIEEERLVRAFRREIKAIEVAERRKSLTDHLNKAAIRRARRDNPDAVQYVEVVGLKKARKTGVNRDHAELQAQLYQLWLLEEKVFPANSTLQPETELEPEVEIEDKGEGISRILGLVTKLVTKERKDGLTPRQAKRARQKANKGLKANATSPRKNIRRARKSKGTVAITVFKEIAVRQNQTIKRTVRAMRRGTIASVKAMRPARVQVEPTTPDFRESNVRPIAVAALATSVAYTA